MKKRKTIFFIIIAILAVIAIAVYITTRLNRPAKYTPSTTSTEAQQEYKVGDSYNNNGLIVTVDKCEVVDTKESAVDIADGNVLIRIHISMKNTTKEALPVGKYSFKCYADSRSLTEKDYYAEDKLAEADRLSSGRIEDGYLYYEVPEKAKLELEYTDSPYSVLVDKSIIFNLTY